MFAAAAALGYWLDELDKIPRHLSCEAWVFVDDRLLAEDLSHSPWLQQAFLPRAYGIVPGTSIFALKPLLLGLVAIFVLLRGLMVFLLNLENVPFTLGFLSLFLLFTDRITLNPC